MDTPARAQPVDPPKATSFRPWLPWRVFPTVGGPAYTLLTGLYVVVVGVSRVKQGAGEFHFFTLTYRDPLTGEVSDFWTAPLLHYSGVSGGLFAITQGLVILAALCVATLASSRPKRGVALALMLAWAGVWNYGAWYYYAELIDFGTTTWLISSYIPAAHTVGAFALAWFAGRRILAKPKRVASST